MLTPKQLASTAPAVNISSTNNNNVEPEGKGTKS